MEAGRCSGCREKLAKFSCSCSHLYCGVCLGTHLDAEDQHSSIPLPKVCEASEIVCELCRGAATYLCLCGLPYRLFCAECDMGHYRDSPNLMHFKYPVAKCQSVIEGQFPIAAFVKKQAYINDLKLHISNQLSDFDTFATGVKAEINALQEQVLHHLEAQRLKLTSTINEIQKVIEMRRYEDYLELCKFISLTYWSMD